MIINPETLTDRGTSWSLGYPEGIEHLIMSGALAIGKGGHTGAKPGKILYRK